MRVLKIISAVLLVLLALAMLPFLFGITTGRIVL